MAQDKIKPQPPARMRCAIYTRKSSDEGLDQSFNSLDAQYEACEAYIASQRQEGWTKLKTRYDDGGISGGTLDRPALQALLAEVDAGRVDMIVVYKIDRLTRSLADFAKLVERLEAKACSFVSVTQAFNTSSSMGRLTLNVLLSFAQFEREVTAERIRDKIAASKAKGMWMGGPVPLGYQSYRNGTERGLSIAPEEADVIRAVFDTYEASRGVYQTVAALRLRGIRGRSAPLNRGQIHNILKNPIYIGQIRHKDARYPGRHEAIISTEQFDRVQALLAKRSGAGPERRPNSPARAPFKGKLQDATGDRLTPTWTKKRSGQMYHYYISSRSLRGDRDADCLRISAKALEATCQAAILQHLRTWLETDLLQTESRAEDLEDWQSRIADLAQAFDRGAQSLLSKLITSGTVSPTLLQLTLDETTLSDILGCPAPATLLSLSRPIRLRKHWKEAKVFLAETRPDPDQPLIKALHKAHLWAQALKDGNSVRSVAKSHGLTDSDLRKRIYLAFLSPELQKAILEGRFPADISLTSLTCQKLPLSWDAQHALLRFPNP